MSDFTVDLGAIHTANTQVTEEDRERGATLFAMLDRTLREKAQNADAIQEALPHELYEAQKAIGEREKDVRAAIRGYLLEFLPNGGGKFQWEGGEVTFTKTVPKYTPNPDCVKDPMVMRMLRKAETELCKDLVVPTINGRYLDECFVRKILDPKELLAAGAVTVKQGTPQVRVKFKG